MVFWSIWLLWRARQCTLGLQACQMTPHVIVTVLLTALNQLPLPFTSGESYFKMIFFLLARSHTLSQYFFLKQYLRKQTWEEVLLQKWVSLASGTFRLRPFSNMPKSKLFWHAAWALQFVNWWCRENKVTVSP